MAEGRILYVEDNFDNRILIKRVLEAEGYKVIEAEDGRRGYELAVAAPPDLILMDINLPDVDGYTCTAQIRQVDALKTIPIIALTANVLEGDRQKALTSGCNGYISKPINVDELPDQIASYLKKHREDEQAAPSPTLSAPQMQKPGSQFVKDTARYSQAIDEPHNSRNVGEG